MKIAPTLKLNKEPPFIWELVLLAVLRSSYISDAITTAVMLVWFVLIFIKVRKIILPKIKNSSLYVFFIIYATAYGTLMFTTREVTRTLFYLVPTLLAICLGYFIQMAYKNKSIFKTIYLIAVLNCVHTVIYVLMNINNIHEIAEVREYAGGFVLEVTIVFVSFFIEKMIYRKVIFGRVIDIIIFVLFTVKIAGSLTRSAIGQVAVGLIAAFIFVLIFDHRKLNLRLGIGVVLFVAIMSFVFSNLPQDAMDSFDEKVDKAGTELSTDQEFRSVSDAMSNWRAFEMQEAKRQWTENKNGLEVVFGEGMGSSVNMRFIPYNWKAEIEGNSIPILHNGYYGMLVYGGVFGEIAMIWFLLGGVVLLIKNYKKMDKIKEYLIINAATGVSMIFTTYVVNGVVTKMIFLNWCLICGCVNAMVIEHQESEDEDEENVETE